MRGNSGRTERELKLIITVINHNEQRNNNTYHILYLCDGERAGGRMARRKAAVAEKQDRDRLSAGRGAEEIRRRERLVTGKRAQGQRHIGGGRCAAAQKGNKQFTPRCGQIQKSN